MTCIPFPHRRRKYQFEAIAKLHSLISVPYVNAVTFAKLRLLRTQHSNQYSSRAEISNHSVLWDTEHRFSCRLSADTDNNSLEPCILKISIRMETKGGKSFHKVGFVLVNLACFAAMGNATARRRYILQGYDEKHKRQDNSLLLASFSMRQLFGDTCFRTPTENLSNCWIVPADSEDEFGHDDGDDDRPGIEIESVRLDGTLTEKTRLLDQSSSYTPKISVCSTFNQSSAPSQYDRFADSLNGNSADILTASPLIESGPSNPNSILVVANRSRSTGHDAFVPALMHGSITPNVVETDTQLKTCQSVDSCSISASGHVTTRTNVVVVGTNPSPIIIDEPCVRSTFSDNRPLSSNSNNLGCSTEISTVRHPVCSNSSGSTVTSNSFSDSSTPATSPFHGYPLTTIGSNNQIPSLSSDQKGSVMSHSPEYTSPHLSSNTTQCHTEEEACRSLPFPVHHYNNRHMLRMGIALGNGYPSEPIHSDYFATDSGLLLPSRRRKARPELELIRACEFDPAVSSNQPSGIALPPGSYSSTTSNSLDLNYSLGHHRTASSTVNPCGSSSLASDSLSSGYQTHSRQSSLDLQQVGGTSVVFSSIMTTKTSTRVSPGSPTSFDPV